jgi:hypothetical protein
MFFSTKGESILTDGSKQKQVKGTWKEGVAGAMNSHLKSITTEKGKYLRHASTEVNMSEEMLSRGAMFANALTSQGYKNILFVGHFNDGQTHWMLDKFAGRMIDLIPPEREHMHTFPDMNIIAQAIPLVMRVYGYEVDFTVARPPEAKYKGAMHSLYDMSGVTNKALECSQQYKHGQSSWTLDGDHEKFDAVVFLGVPMEDQSVGFEEDQVREIFAPMCTPEFDMVDIYYGAPSSVKWYNGEKKESDSMVDTAFSIRSQWDEDTAKGRPEESDIMKKMISVF